MDNKSFDSRRIALGYAKRPWLHKSVIEQLKMDCNLDADYKFGNGLDVGCGAGLSTKALRLICEKVTGTDIADSMIDVCEELYSEDSAYTFYASKAEETKIPAEKYDIVTAAGLLFTGLQPANSNARSQFSSPSAKLPRWLNLLYWPVTAQLVRGSGE